MKRILIIIALTAFSQNLLAAMKFQLKPEVGKIAFKTKGWPNLVTIKGEGKGVTGQLDEKDGKISGQLTFDLTTLKTGIELRDDHMKNNYLEVAKHPAATLKLDSISAPENYSGKIKFKGMMTLHGVEKEVTGEAELSNNDETVELKGQFPVQLSDFKIAIPSYKGITVAEKVNIDFELKASKL